MNRPPVPECPEAYKISYATIGHLDAVCPTQADIDALVVHILRQCEYCLWLHTRNSAEQGTLGKKDVRLFPLPRTEKVAI